MKLARLLLGFMVLLVLTLLATAVYADSSYNEGSQGDLSGDRTAPSTFALTPGQNRLTATSVRGDREYVTLAVPQGYQLEHLIVASYVSSDAVAFAGLQAGVQFTEPPTGTNPANLLGYAHFGPGRNNVGADILDDMGAMTTTIGFTAPLPSGNYTLWLQQAGPSTTTYSLDFMVAPAVKAPLYNEAIDGDLSGDRQNPISRTLTVGGNLVTATSVRGDVEYLHVNVPLGHQLKALLLADYQSPDKKAFAAIQRGTRFTEPPTGTNVGRLLGYSHLGPAVEPVGADYLDNMGKGAGAFGFTGALGSGDYTLWLQQTGITTTTYTIDLVVSPVATRTLYAESTGGDLAGDAAAPTALTAAAGGNVLSASSVQGDREYFKLEVPAGHQLEAIFLTSYNSTDQKAFIAVQKGATFTEPPTGTTVAKLLGYSHFGPAVEPVGSNLLDNMGSGQGAIGFSGALPSVILTLARRLSRWAAIFWITWEAARAPSALAAPCPAGSTPSGASRPVAAPRLIR